MKGQYLAVESVLTVAMGLSLAIGVISVFGTYQDDISQTTQEKELEIVNYRVQNAINDLKNADSGTATIDLPEKIGGVSYNVVLTDRIEVVTAREEYSHPVQTLRTAQASGSTEGGEVILYKSGNEYNLRSS